MSKSYEDYIKDSFKGKLITHYSMADKWGKDIFQDYPSMVFDQELPSIGENHPMVEDIDFPSKKAAADAIAFSQEFMGSFDPKDSRRFFDEQIAKSLHVQPQVLGRYDYDDLKERALKARFSEPGILGAEFKYTRFDPSVKIKVGDVIRRKGDKSGELLVVSKVVSRIGVVMVVGQYPQLLAHQFEIVQEAS